LKGGDRRPGKHEKKHENAATWYDEHGRRIWPAKKEEPMLEPLYAISVWNCRAAVCRRADLAPGTWTYQEATNWEDLEEEAIALVEAAGGAVNMSGLYPCPLNLAEKAIFQEDMDPAAIRQLAGDLLTGYLTRQYTPREAAQQGRSPEGYVKDLWEVALPGLHERGLTPRDFYALRAALLGAVRAEMGG
jgi:hypothetical protein